MSRHPTLLLLLLLLLVLLSSALQLSTAAAVSGCYDTGVTGAQRGASWTDTNYIACGSDWPLSIAVWADVNGTLCGLYVGYSNGASSGMHGVKGTQHILVNLDVSDRITNMTWYADSELMPVALTFATLNLPTAISIGNVSDGVVLWTTDGKFTQPNTYIAYLEGRAWYNTTANTSRITGLGVGYYVPQSEQRSMWSRLTQA